MSGWRPSVPTGGEKIDVVEEVQHEEEPLHAEDEDAYADDNDVAATEDEMGDEDLRVKWVNTKQQLADTFTKGSLDAAIYLMLDAKTTIFALAGDLRLVERMADF